MSLTDEVINFLKENNQLSNFCALVGISQHELSEWLFDAISPDNIENFFDFGVVVKCEELWCNMISKKWSEYLIGVHGRRNKSRIDGLVAISFDNSIPQVLRDIAEREIKEIDNDPFVANPIVARSIFQQCFSSVEKKIEVDPSHVCKNCEFCNFSRSECDKDIWWDISKIDINTKTCKRFKDKRRQYE